MGYGSPVTDQTECVEETGGSEGRRRREAMGGSNKGEDDPDSSDEDKKALRAAEKKYMVFEQSCGDLLDTGTHACMYTVLMHAVHTTLTVLRGGPAQLPLQTLCNLSASKIAVFTRWAHATCPVVTLHCGSVITLQLPGWKGSRNSLRYSVITAVIHQYCAYITRRLTRLHAIMHAATSVPGLYRDDYAMYM